MTVQLMKLIYGGQGTAPRFLTFVVEIAIPLDVADLNIPQAT